MNKQHILAYLAGYTDGDGCFSIGKTKRKSGTFKYNASFVISSTDIAILNDFNKIFEGSITLSSNKIESHKTQYHFLATGKKAQTIAKTLLPYLIEKREQCECFLLYFESIKDRENTKIDLDNARNHKNLVTKDVVEEIKSLETTIFPSVEDFHYLAGFIDAECCLGLGRYKSKTSVNFIYKSYLHCNNTKFPTIKWIKERFEGHVRFVDRKTKNFNHRDQIAWRLCSKTLHVLLPEIIDHLRFKKPVCEELIKFSNLTLKNGGARHTEDFRLSYSKNLIERDKIFHTIHSLNQKGV